MNKRMYVMGKARLTNASHGVLLLHVSGVSDPDACEHFELLITKALAYRPRVVVVDLSEADSVSTVMLGLLLNLRKGAATVGGEVRLAGVQPMVRRVLNICQLDQLFNIFSSSAAAMEVGEVATAM